MYFACRCVWLVFSFWGCNVFFFFVLGFSFLSKPYSATVNVNNIVFVSGSQFTTGCLMRLPALQLVVFLSECFFFFFFFQISHLSISQWSLSLFWRATSWNSTALQRPTLLSRSTGEIAIEMLLEYSETRNHPVMQTGKKRFIYIL